MQREFSPDPDTHQASPSEADPASDPDPHQALPSEVDPASDPDAREALPSGSDQAVSADSPTGVPPSDRAFLDEAHDAFSGKSATRLSGKSATRPSGKSATPPSGRTATRIFLGRDTPLLPQAAHLLLDRARTIEPEDPGAPRRLDLSDVLVALPGARAGRRLTELLLEETERRSAILLPPRITTVGGLPERFYRSSRPEPDPVLSRTAWVAALRRLDPEDSALLLMEPPEAGDDEGWLRLARTVQSLHSQVGAGGWTFHRVAEQCRDGLLFNDEERWRTLALVQDAYREILARHGRMDREEARRRVLAGSEARLEGQLWLIGAPDLPPIVRRFLTEADHPRPHTVLIAAPDQESDAFDVLGEVVPERWETAVPPIPEERVRVVGGPASQADAVVEALAVLDGRYSAEEITVGVTDPTIAPYVVERLSGEDVPVRYAAGRPVARTALFRLIEALAEYLEGRDFDAFSALLRHPTVERALRIRLERGAEGGRDANGRPPRIPSLEAHADRYQGVHLPLRLESGPLPSGGELSWEPVQPGLRAIRDALDLLLEPFGAVPSGAKGRGARPSGKEPSGTDPSGETRRLAGWAAPIQRVLVAIQGEELLHRHAVADRETLEVAGRIRGILEGMQALPPELDPPVSGPCALRSLLGELREEAVPPEAEGGAIELLGWLELALDDAPVMVVTAVNEPHLPEAVTADPFLPHALRSRLGLLDNRGRWARDLLHLRMILEGRSEITLIAGRVDADGNPLRLSRLLLCGEPRAIARRLLRFLGGETGAGERAPGFDGARAGMEDALSGRGFLLPPEPVISAETPPTELAVTAFRRVLGDPYIYALEQIRRLEAVDDRAREMDGGHFGTLAHAVLEAWGRGPASGSTDAGEIRRALEVELDREALARFGRRPLPAVRLQIEQLRARLGGFARWQAEWSAEGWEIRAVEAMPAAKGVRFDVDGSAILLRGRIDRVDHHPGRGEWLLLDYKTGEKVDAPDRAHRRGRGQDRRWIDLQLPLYRHLAPALQGGAEGTQGRAEGTPGGEAVTPGGEAGTPGGAAAPSRLIPPDELASVRMGYLALPRDRNAVCVHLADWSDEELEEADEAARDVIRLLRRNRFEYRRGETRAWKGSPLSTLLGAGVMAVYGDDPDDPGEGGTDG